MQKKLVVIVSVIIICLFAFVACNSKYGEAITYFSAQQTQVYFDGKGNCNYDGLPATYYIKDNVYYVTYNNLTRELTKINGNDALVDKGKNVSNFSSDKRSGFLSTSFSIATMTYNLYVDGSFRANSATGLWLAQGKYFFNDGILVLRHDMSLSDDYNISNVVWWYYGYVDTDGIMYPVILSNPAYYQQQHSANDDNNNQDNDNNNNQDNDDDNDNDNIVYDLQYNIKTYDTYPDGNVIENNGGYLTGSTTQQITNNQDATPVTAYANYGYKFVGWSDGITTAERQDTNVTQNITVTAIFEIGTECFAHENLNTGDICPICGKECYLRQNGDILMYNADTGNMYAEYYNSTAGDVFDVFSNQIAIIYISNNVENIESRAFDSYAVSGILFEENSRLTSIGNSAFYYCHSLTSITIPDSVISIYQHAFSSCNNLINISIGENLQIVGKNAFDNTEWWNSQENNSLIYIGNVCYAVKGSLPINTSISIKEGTKTIADACFMSQGGLRYITIPQSLNWVGGEAFKDCLALLQVQGGDNIANIEQDAFLNTAFYDNENNWQDGALYIGKVLYSGQRISGDYTIKGTTISINPYAFSGNKNISSIVIPDSITSIANYTFFDCESLTSVTIGNSVTSIGDYAFSNCSSLASIIIPDSVTSIGAYAFDLCTNLSTIIIPDSVTSIGDHIFRACDSLTTIYCEATSKPSGWSSFWNSSNCSVIWGYQG